ncbi:ceramidase [Methylobacterium sp. BTF04]|uniref:ceramidase domain-containing protein n=1 Tax=Methylobacterium sp. BTF04 TaxID=2708300 RepID=UPI0013D2FAE3|nr:ceramidase domain-containing protein [Methylobacterium sp. BTF04]NEU12128.1 ceramidase [Methylobacterium sp. BTF04]
MSETWFAPIRAYCERGDAGFWAEPLNALSNGAFLVAAVAAGWQALRSPRRDAAALALAILVGIVGLGSFLFHTLAVRWSLLADVIPIAVFIHAYFFLALRRYFGLGTVAATGITLAFAALNIGLEPALDAATGRSLAALTNGSIGYVPALLALAGFGAGLLLPQGCALGPARRQAGRALLGIAAVFAVSLAARTGDARLCAGWPLGTHFVWHILNAGVLYGLVTVALRYRARTA